MEGYRLTAGLRPARELQQQSPLIYTWSSQTEWSPSQLPIETKGEGILQDLLSVLQGNGEALTHNYGDEGPTHIYNQSLECPHLL